MRQMTVQRCAILLDMAHDHEDRLGQGGLIPARGDLQRSAVAARRVRARLLVVLDLPVSDRKQALDQLVAAWSLEVEPSQRIALAKIIGHVAGP